jgi:hypothetical protein
MSKIDGTGTKIHEKLAPLEWGEKVPITPEDQPAKAQLSVKEAFKKMRLRA